MDITLGQFFPGNSLVHKLDPRTKIVLTILFIATIFIISGLIAYTLTTLFLLILIYISKIPLKTVVKSLKPLVFIIAFTSVLNIFFTQGTVIFSFYFISVTYEGVRLAIFMVWRIIMLIAGSSLLTYTTSPILLTDGIEKLLSPLKKLKFPVHEFSMMMTIALRFIPTLIEETEKIINAQKARGADFESGNLIKRAKALVPILIPLFISSFRRADELAVAMECRLYRGDVGRTRMKVLKLKPLDYTTFIVTSAIFAILILV